MDTRQNGTMLQVKGLNTFYGKAQILFDLKLEMSRGEVVVLLGRNGAGKTTTFKSIIGIVPPRSGKITYTGVAIEKLPPFKTCALGLGYVPEDRRIFSGLTILENLEVGRQPARQGYEAWTPERLFDLFPNLAERRSQAGGTLSGGEQQMLTIARTLMGNPAMIILDEPSEGLAPVVIDQLAITIQKLKDEGVSILLAEQNLNFARFICDRAYLIYQGSICHESDIDSLSNDEYEKYCSI
jgi:branched-chain amino acid transport system ATP-binding protein